MAYLQGSREQVAHNRLMESMHSQIDAFDRAFHQNEANGWRPGQYRVVADHTRPGQQRVQHLTALMSGKPEWRKVFTGTPDECQRYIRKQLSDAAV